MASLPDRLRSGQSAFDLTGGLHACGLFHSNDGTLEVLREDVGRHNAVDKALGHLLLQDKLPSPRSILLVSGRISFEIMQKALAAGVPIVAGISAPTSLAVEFARESGQLLIAFLRDQRFNSYGDQT
jgi:FdhD protein